MNWQALAEPMAAVGAVAGLFLFLGALAHVSEQVTDAWALYRLRRRYTRRPAR